jgi:hypothetical protein
MVNSRSFLAIDFPLPESPLDAEARNRYRMDVEPTHSCVACHARFIGESRLGPLPRRIVSRYSRVAERSMRGPRAEVIGANVSVFGSELFS